PPWTVKPSMTTKGAFMVIVEFPVPVASTIDSFLGLSRSSRASLPAWAPKRERESVLIVTYSLYLPGPTRMMSPDTAAVTAFWMLVYSVALQLELMVWLGTHRTVKTCAFAVPARRRNTTAIAAGYTKRFRSFNVIRNLSMKPPTSV